LTALVSLYKLSHVTILLLLEVRRCYLQQPKMFFRECLKLFRPSKRSLEFTYNNGLQFPASPMQHLACI